MEEQKCEHELNLIDESWMSENAVMATCKCNKCNCEFRGLLIRVQEE